ncbi:MAG: TrmH family RNA methyltransferase [Saprospiraceae bacterium]|nr:TrmH family RNA methyltransferase [Saprospiraceae bacterium]
MLIRKTMTELGRPQLEPLRQSEKLPIIVILENLRSGLNIGSIFRTADAFHIKSICLTGISVIPPHREILKTALDATLSVDWKYLPDVNAGLLEFKKQGYQIVAVEQTQGSVPLSEFIFDLHTPVVLVFGNEVSGVSDAVLANADRAIEIPQSGIKHSLNVAVCAGIVLWQAYHQLNQ